MNNAVYKKTMENFRKNLCKTPKQKKKKRLLKMDIKTKLYFTKNI